MLNIINYLRNANQNYEYEEISFHLTTAVTLGLTAEEVGDCIFPHPTMCEAIMEALHDLHGVSIHKV